jgi:capsular polysaccharide biosynthesis protein
MFLRGLGIKAGLKKAVTTTIKSLVPAGKIYNAPRTLATSAEWLAKKDISAGKIIQVYKEELRKEPDPYIFNYVVSGRFKKYSERKIPAAFVVELRNGMVYGRETNFIIAPDYTLLADLSREFGKYGGKPMHKSSIIKQELQLPECTFLKGRVAVLSTCGSNNFHHWNYDIIPRVHLLKQAGIFSTIDYFIISWSGTPFQKESLRLLGIPEERIINPLITGCFHYEAEWLIVPSLPSPLGTVSPWVVTFLRDLYNSEHKKKDAFSKIYLSRKKVTSRKIINNDAFNKLLNAYGIKEVFPEDYTVSELAELLAGAKFVISIHGSGLSNICFISEKTIIIDILAPYHQDGYYWMLSNIRNSKYIGFFGEGAHPKDDLDLVKNKIDDDFYLDLDKVTNLFSNELRNL